MSHFQFQTVPNIISGLGSIQELQNILSSKTYRKLLLVTDAGMVKNQLHRPILQILDTLNLEYVIYADVQADPPEQVVLDAANYAKQQNVDVIIGFGGGSSLDVAKVIALLAHPNQTQHLQEMYGVNQVTTARLPLILIPTTAGTGSEVTPISIVTTGETTKMGIVSQYCMPTQQFLMQPLLKTFQPILLLRQVLMRWCMPLRHIPLSTKKYIYRYFSQTCTQATKS